MNAQGDGLYGQLGLIAHGPACAFLWDQIQRDSAAAAPLNLGVDTGHPGSMTTIHADTPARAIEQLALLVLQAGSKLAREDIRHYVRESVDVFVQLERLNGKRRVSRILVGA